MKIDQIIRTRRKTIALIVEKDGRLVVRAPLQVSDAVIHKMVQEKQNWIRKKQKQARSHYPSNQVRRFVDGESFYFMGKTFPLRIVDRIDPPLVLGRKFYLSREAQPRAKQIFIDWYRQQARQVISKRVAHFANKNGFKYRRMRITSARTRWGSCSSNGNLNFSWRLMMAPPQVIDYVVVHELAHLRVKNHSKEFWAQVERILPDYQQQKSWLKQHGSQFPL